MNHSGLRPGEWENLRHDNRFQSRDMHPVGFPGLDKQQLQAMQDMTRYMYVWSVRAGLASKRVAIDLL